MGYRTVMRVPRIADYNAALKKYDTTPRIRGRENIVPLGDRRDCDTYSIRKNVWTDAIELVLYQTPVIKFTVEDEVVLNHGSWPSASTCQFISQVLGGVSARRVRGEVALEFADGSVAMMEQDKELVLVRGTNGRWQPKQKQKLYDYRVNRKGANNVRASVSMFKDYMKGVVKLKTEEMESYGYMHEGVSFTFEELFDVFGKVRVSITDDELPDITPWRVLDDKRHDNYWDMAEKFFELIKNDQDDNTRHQNYWIAFCILGVGNAQIYGSQVRQQKIYRDPKTFEHKLDKFLLTMFSSQVFTRVELPEGKVPTGKYDNFVGVKR